ncbi:hypothetical protein THIX_60796 [Thiomonas sp. X19]|uniref:hypothetical protein n=1 Tax=Thiomonas sp. X19 TaxID=1050370 RepID=UPI000B68BF58|nr:hypothetical protein [Thiomonas sp. X19]SCC94738.1 hypothetical protein THIX_60796 [Thiomonas sp. X19]
MINIDIQFASPLDEALRSNPDGGESIGELFILEDVAHAEDGFPVGTRDEAIAIHEAQVERADLSRAEEEKRKKYYARRKQTGLRWFAWAEKVLGSTAYRLELAKRDAACGPCEGMSQSSVSKSRVLAAALSALLARQAAQMDARAIAAERDPEEKDDLAPATAATAGARARDFTSGCLDGPPDVLGERPIASISLTPRILSQRPQFTRVPRG